MQIDCIIGVGWELAQLNRLVVMVLCVIQTGQFHNIFAMEQPEELEYHVYRDYEILEKIGRGTYGVVFKARHKRTRNTVAVKKIIDAFQNLIDAKRTYRQLNYLLQLEHPSVVRLHHILLAGRKGAHQLPSTARFAAPLYEIRGCNTDKLPQRAHLQQRHVYAVFEHVESDLRVALKRCSELQSIQRKFIAFQLLHAIAYLHRSGLIHRDVKPQNLLIDCGTLTLKICDFGMARLQTSHPCSEGVLTEYVASRWYRPPEALLSISTCEPAIDLWSVGCVLAELALKTPLFAGKSTLDQLQVIFRCIGKPTNEDIDKLPSQEAQYVLRNFSFSRKSKLKPLKDVLNMCQNEEIDLIVKLLMFDPKMRISAQHALTHSYFDQVRGLCPQLQDYAHKISRISDFLENNYLPQSQDRIHKKSPDVEHYRLLVEELQRFAQKSLSRSGGGNVNDSAELETKIAHFNCKQYQNQEDSSGFKEKSTKQSNFVVQNKHAFTKQREEFVSPKSNFEQVEKNFNLFEKTKTKSNFVQEEVKKVTEKSQKNIFLKYAEQIKENQRKKKRKQQKSKKQRQFEKKDGKRQLNFTKIQRERQNSKEILFSSRIKQKGQSFVLERKKSKKKSQSSHIKPNKKSLGDNRSLLSNQSSGYLTKEKQPVVSISKKKLSNHSVVKQNSMAKAKKKDAQFMAKKQELIKKLIKPGINLTKTGVPKCKSVHNINYLKR